MKTFLRIATLSFAGLAFAAAAQTYPARPVHWIVPFPAGSATDVMSRAIAQPVSAALGKPVVVENRAGAQTLIGLEAAAKAAAPGGPSEGIPSSDRSLLSEQCGNAWLPSAVVRTNAS